MHQDQRKANVSKYVTTLSCCNGPIMIKSKVKNNKDETKSFVKIEKILKLR